MKQFKLKKPTTLYVYATQQHEYTLGMGYLYCAVNSSQELLDIIRTKVNHKFNIESKAYHMGTSARECVKWMDVISVCLLYIDEQDKIVHTDCELDCNDIQGDATHARHIGPHDEKTEEETVEFIYNLIVQWIDFESIKDYLED